MKRNRSFEPIEVVASLESGWQLITSNFIKSSSMITLTLPPVSLIAPSAVTAPGMTPRYSISFSGLPKETLLAAPMTWCTVFRSTVACSSTVSRK
ncbi:hypothetical protein D3C72_1970850 [compost metagenome]